MAEGSVFYVMQILMIIATCIYVFILLCLAYWIYKHTIASRNERFQNSRMVSASDAQRVMYPAQWKSIHRGDLDIHPVEF